jgi:2,5-diketo-D-gluconate reductase A
MDTYPRDVPNMTLADGVEIPQLGFGVWQVPPADTARVVADALQAGYRHIDTAQMYQNEAGVGGALRAAGLNRDEVFVTTKCNNANHSFDAAISGLETSLTLLGLEYVDLYLIHWPQPSRDQYVETWRGFVEAKRRGLARSIGVSNFHAPYLERLIAETGVTPSVNQVELHPLLTQEPLVAECRRLGVAIESWSPLASGAILDNPVISQIAAVHGKSVAQVVIRWHLQLGYIVIPKSVTPARIAANIDVFDFELTSEEITRISGLNEDSRTGPDPAVLG